MEPLEIAVIVFVGLCLSFIVYQFATKGFKGATFGAKVIRTFDRIDMASVGGMRGHVRIHKLQHKEKELIGIEVVQESFAGFDMTPLRFERDELEAFIRALQNALSEIDETGPIKTNQII